MLARWIALVLATLAVAAPLAADDLRPGYLELTETGPNTWRMIWKAPINGGLVTRASPALPPACDAADERRELVGAAVVSVWTVRCTRLLAGAPVGLLHLDAGFTDALLRVAPLGRPVQAARLTATQPIVTVRERSDRAEVAQTYFKFGVEHIILGFDHLMFVVALVLLLHGGWRVASTVTAFTIAHSLTLIGTTLGLVSLPRAPVESVIALSILFLAVEIVKAAPGKERLSERFPWIVAFLFGLLHGFGFAAALAEVGMPEGEVPVALLTFNIGVEAGQLVIVAAAFAMLALVRTISAAAVRPARIASAYAIGTTASFWFIARTLA